MLKLLSVSLSHENIDKQICGLVPRISGSVGLGSSPKICV